MKNLLWKVCYVQSNLLTRRRSWSWLLVIGHIGFKHGCAKSIKSLESLPATIYHSQPPTYIPKDLASAEVFYVRQDAVRGPLQQPYDGTFREVRREPKFFFIHKNSQGSIPWGPRNCHLSSPELVNSSCNYAIADSSTNSCHLLGRTCCKATN